MEYYVVKSKETGLYFRGKGVNRWGKYFNQASIYRMKAKAEETARWLSKGDEDCEVKTIHIIEENEMEIRNKVIDEFVKRFNDICDPQHDRCNDFSNCNYCYLAGIQEIAEQMKEEI